MTSFPVGVLRFAGDWSVTENYLYGMYVIAGGGAYACGAVSDTGTDPTTQPSVVWFPFPSTGGAGVASLQNLTGALSLQSPNGSITINPSGSTIDLETAGAGGSSITAGGATVACDDPAATGSITLTTTAGTTGDVEIDTTAAASGAIQLRTNSNINLTTLGSINSIILENPTAGSSLVIGSQSVDFTSPSGSIKVGGSQTPTGLYVSNTQLLFNNVEVTRPNVISKFGSTSGALALTASYQNMATQTYTTTVSSAPLTVWGTLNLLDAGGGGATLVSARLLINGTAGIVQQITLDNNHSGQIVCLGGGTGPVGGGAFNVAIQALVTVGAASRITASVITIGQTTLSP
jgi:hypothetical protein